MEYWFTADLHLGHNNILKLCRRDAFLSPQEIETLERNEPLKVTKESGERHDDTIIQNINAVVEPGDELWVLGDFCWGGSSKAASYLDRIACKNANLVQGNHDSDSVLPLFRQAWQQGMLEADGQRIWLNHYPMRSWDRSFHGSWQLYGHVHGRMKHLDDADPCVLTMDVGVDPLKFQPISLTQLRAHFAPKEVAFRQRKLGLSGKGSVDWA